MKNHPRGLFAVNERGASGGPINLKRHSQFC